MDRVDLHVAEMLHRGARCRGSRLSAEKIEERLRRGPVALIALPARLLMARRTQKEQKISFFLPKSAQKAILGGGVGFEFDPGKSAANARKHGIDFVEAQEVFEDVNRLEVPAKTSGERRIATIGKRGEQIWVVIWTPRGRNVRVISVRRAREGELRLYEGEKD